MNLTENTIAIGKDYFRPEELQGERITNWIRLIFIFIFPALLLIAVSNNNWVLSTGNLIVLSGIGAGGLYSFALIYFLNEKRYFPSIKFLSAIVESVIVTTVVFSGAFDLFASAGTIFIVNTFHIYFLLTGLSVLRFSFLASFFSGICNAAGYSFLIYWAKNQGAFDGIFKGEISNLPVRFSLDNEIFKVLFLILMGIVTGYATKRNKHLLSLYIEKKQELDKINSGLEELVIERTEELFSKQRIIERELDMARDLQQILLPQDLPSAKNFRITAKYIPMDKVGGDFYDVCVLANGKWGIFVCDVSGHGVPAAIIASMVKMSLEQKPGEYSRPSQILSHINEKLIGRIGKNFVTAFYSIFDPVTGELEYANAGHIHPIHISSTVKNQTLLNPKGMLLGFKEDPSFENNHVTLLKSDRIIIYTDGITEARNPGGELYGEIRFVKFVKAQANLKGNDLIDGILKDIQSYSQKPGYDDDITVVV
ncbi:MAG: serine/threonine-protein phosphatase, partial [Leptospira sp.]|nr:serine/threonine-protein phosphatase [Leptospira sp.]